MSDTPPSSTVAGAILSKIKEIQAAESAAPISLRAQDEAVPNVKDRIALKDAGVRQAVSIWIMALFGVVNLFTLGLIVWLAFGDRHELKLRLIDPAGRLVTAQVVMALLGATTVQLGTIAVIMARYVFKQPEGAG